MTNVLICDSIYGTYYIADGDIETMKNLKSAMEPYMTYPLRIIIIDESKLEALKEDTEQFNKEFSIVSDTDSTEEEDEDLF